MQIIAQKILTFCIKRCIIVDKIETDALPDVCFVSIMHD